MGAASGNACRNDAATETLKEMKEILFLGAFRGHRCRIGWQNDAEIRAAVQRELLEMFEGNHEGVRKIFKGVSPSFHKSHFNISSVV